MWEQIITLCCAIAVAALSYLLTWITNKNLREKVSGIEDALQSDDAEYYVECPNCKTKICLSKVKIIAEKRKKEN